MFIIKVSLLKCCKKRTGQKKFKFELNILEKDRNEKAREKCQSVTIDGSVSGIQYKLKDTYVNDTLHLL